MTPQRLSIDCADGVHDPDSCDASTCSCACHRTCGTCGYAGPGLCPCDTGLDLIRGK